MPKRKKIHDFLIAFRLSTEQLEKIDSLAKEANETRSEFLRDALDHYLETS